ncbi:MAG: class D beta-lactamase [Chlorogloeopsis fritschii C42_A2020_084]|uniref:class D beta-lactamase n=1 Tax=Chlorogloeopsis fritschii TaxID=1124 RepID=UPI0019FA5661|nr:class D beta-lactamase [Chlorogloeopsis fritschii]MBF2006113.1 class D beta-lactamase [Chlorogloeopsis fritschii C42_A2020_084]
MNRIVRLVMIVFVVLCCIATIMYQTVQSVATTPNSAIKSPNHLEVAQNIDFARHFRELGVEGSIIIYDSNNNRIFQHNPSRNKTAFVPASTFKILNSLIALETGVIPDEIAVLTWDGIQRKLPEWNRDLNMREAINLSAIWFYQVLARRVGHERMQKWVTQVGYGNQKIGSKEDIDKFWLRGELRTTPEQQIQFLRRFYNHDLPFSKRSLDLVKKIMILEKTPDYTITGKTGWVGFDDGVKPQIGWLVGYLERGKNVYFFATNIEIRKDKDASARMEVTRRCFKDLRLL